MRLKSLKTTVTQVHFILVLLFQIVSILVSVSFCSDHLYNYTIINCQNLYSSSFSISFTEFSHLSISFSFIITRISLNSRLYCNGSGRGLYPHIWGVRGITTGNFFETERPQRHLGAFRCIQKWNKKLSCRRDSARRRSLRRARSFKVTDNSTNREPICDFLLVINANLQFRSYCRLLVTFTLSTWVRVPVFYTLVRAKPLNSGPRRLAS